MEMKMIDAASGGALVNMSPQRARELVSTMAVNSQQYQPPMEPTRRVHELSTPSIILLEDTTAQVDAVGNFQGPPQRCYDLYSNTYNVRWRDHPSLSYGLNHRYNQPYQLRPPPPQQYQPPKSSLKTIIKRLAVSTEKFQQNTKVHLQEMDQLISKLALAVSHLENQGKLPSENEPNPYTNASAVNVKDGKDSELVLGTSCDHEVEQEAEPAAPTKPAPHKPFFIPHPYPGRLTQVKKERKEKEILKTFQKVKINIPILDAIK
ncbi:uncharacterized protein [Gossypium hirsutum]|uniref:Uncharacterized protein n=1 Tax=Gossypium hirsutum TaxID=3635 RepID=A0A1U8IRI6_GOSHI|nr:uncharacterized protein LOC107897993 [Gossypium hirsutum]